MNISYVGKVIALKPIGKADKIESAEVVCGKGGKWSGVVKKGDFVVGSTCAVFLPDALLPERPEYEFLRARHFRVTQCRLRGARSEVLIMPWAKGGVGDVLDLELGVTKYEKPLDPSVGGDIAGNFPSFIPKTDEPNFQVVPHMLRDLADRPFYATEKADGSSCTAYKLDGVLHICSRNFELKDTEKSAGWCLARKFNLAECLPERVAIQFEMVGAKIQGNPMGLEELGMRVFNLYDMEKQSYGGYMDLVSFCIDRHLPLVKIVEVGDSFYLDTPEKLQNFAKGLYANGNPREGVVIRPQLEGLSEGERLSFKVINLKYGK